MEGALLAWALEALSGYVAADELSEGPYGVLLAVDHRQYSRQYRRMLSQVLDHDPTHDDMKAFRGRLQEALEARDLVLKGITTDGSALSPEALRAVFGGVPPQLCTFHVIAALVKGVLSAVAAERQRLAKAKPKWKRGRPASNDQEARRLARQSQAMQEKIHALFEGRFLFVTRRLTPSERHRLLRITHGLPQLRQRREIMEHLYALFDRRCRTPTALNKLRKLRHWVKRFRWIGDTLNKVFAPHLAKARSFLADKLLPAASNAVERGNRRHRKRQKSVYRIRSKVC
jgi:hypothetical protein